MLHTKFVEEIKTRVLCSKTFFFFFSKIVPLWDNVEKCGKARQGTDDSIIWRMRFTCWINNLTNTHWEQVILIGFSRQQWLRERASILCYTYSACLVVYYCFPKLSYSKDLALLARYPALVGSCLQTFRDSLSFPFPYHLKMAQKCFPEKSINN